MFKKEYSNHSINSSSKGQSAMEYLMTYGWSILIIAIALVILFELGVFKSSSFSGNGSCVAQTGYLCTKTTLATNGVLTATIGDDFGQVTLTGFACVNNSSPPTTFSPVSSIPFSNGETMQLAFNCRLPSNAIGSSFNGNLWLQYNTPSASGQKSRIATVSLRVTQISSSSGSGNQQIYYVPVTLSNDQSSAVSANFQQMITFNALAYSSNEMANLSNIEFTATAPAESSGNVPLDAWIESGASSTAANTVVWVNLGTNTIGAAGGANTLTVYMNFLPNNSPVTDGYTGYAPQLWCASGCFQTAYAQNDIGAKVFNFYDNFAGTSLSSKWTVISSLVSGDTATVNNGLSLSFTSGTTGNYILYSTTTFPQNSIVENLFSTNVFTTNLRTANPSFSSSNTEKDLVDFIGYGASSLSINKAGLGYWTNILPDSTDYVTNDDASATNWITGIGYSNNFYLYGFLSTTPYSYQPYIQTSSESLGAVSGNLYIQLGVSTQGVSSNFVESWTWVRTRTYPPNGIMPALYFGGVV